MPVEKREAKMSRWVSMSEEGLYNVLCLIPHLQKRSKFLKRSWTNGRCFLFFIVSVAVFYWERELPVIEIVRALIEQQFEYALQAPAMSIPFCNRVANSSLSLWNRSRVLEAHHHSKFKGVHYPFEGLTPIPWIVVTHVSSNYANFLGKKPRGLFRYNNMTAVRSWVDDL